MSTFINPIGVPYMHHVAPMTFRSRWVGNARQRRRRLRWCHRVAHLASRLGVPVTVEWVAFHPGKGVPS